MRDQPHSNAPGANSASSSTTTSSRCNACGAEPRPAPSRGAAPAGAVERCSTEGGCIARRAAEAGPAWTGPARYLTVTSTRRAAGSSPERLASACSGLVEHHARRCDAGGDEESRTLNGAVLGQLLVGGELRRRPSGSRRSWPWPAVLAASVAISCVRPLACVAFQRGRADARSTAPIASPRTSAAAARRPPWPRPRPSPAAPGSPWPSARRTAACRRPGGRWRS